MILNGKIKFYTTKLSNLQRMNISRLLWRELRSLGLIDSSWPETTLSVSANDINDYFVNSVI